MPSVHIAFLQRREHRTGCSSEELPSYLRFSKGSTTEGKEWVGGKGKTAHRRAIRPLMIFISIKSSFRSAPFRRFSMMPRFIWAFAVFSCSLCWKRNAPFPQCLNNCAEVNKYFLWFVLNIVLNRIVGWFNFLVVWMRKEKFFVSSFTVPA